MVSNSFNMGKKEKNNEDKILISQSCRQQFKKWLSSGNFKKYSPEISVDCMDTISKYALEKKISDDLWGIGNPKAFKSIYQKIAGERLLRITEKNAYKIFLVVGKAYIEFLEEIARQNLPVEEKNQSRSDLNIKQMSPKYQTEELVDNYNKGEEYKSDNKQGKIMSFINEYQYDEMGKETISIISSKFKNGFRKLSNIDYERYKNFHMKEYGYTSQYNEVSLNNLLNETALLYDDRYYIYSTTVIDSIHFIIEQISSPCIHIDYLYNEYSNELYNFNIYSIDMLKTFIEKYYQDIKIKYDYILLQENIVPSDLVIKLFDENDVWMIEEIEKKLPYLKLDTIRQTMSRKDFFRVEKDKYTSINNLDLPNDRGEEIVAFIAESLSQRSYVIANELDLSVFEKLNYNCPYSTIRDAVFYKFLSAKYEKSGQVITKKGEKLRVIDILEQYCCDVDTVTFEELNALEAEFDSKGRSHSQCLIAGHNRMVRVSAELFVSDKMVDFDVLAIDNIIELYCRGDFIPLKEIKDFSLFPYAGYVWNLFLLESYVRRFSNTFKYEARAVNSANVGVIVRKIFSYSDYDNILALALADSFISLNDREEVGNYLFDRGYIGWRNLGKNEDNIIKIAKELREGGAV